MVKKVTDIEESGIAAMEERREKGQRFVRSRYGTASIGKQLDELMQYIH
jgi:hypothetical protein